MLWALLLVGLFTMVAIVIDLGALRADRRTDRAAADAAATAGAADLSVSSSEGCTTAVSYAAQNLGLDDSAFAPVGAGCASWTSCATAGPARSVTYAGRGYDVTITHPVPTTDPLLAGADAVGGDIQQNGSALDGAQCDRIGVAITYKRATIFARVVGNNSNTTTVHSVARLNPDGPPDEPASLVLLERHDCRAARTQGNDTRIVISSIAPTPAEPTGSPGIIQADSAGDGACGGQTKVLEGGSGPLGPAIYAENARNGAGFVTKEARIGVYAKLLGSPNAHSTWPTDIGEPNPVGFRQIGRTPVDERFLENVRALDVAATPVVESATVPGGFTNATGPAPGLNLGCTIDTATAITAVSKLWFNCPGGLTVKNLAITSSDAEVVINGPLSITGSFTIRDSRKLWVRGRTTGNKIGVDVNGTLSVNNDGFPLCTQRFAADRTKIGTFFVKEGSFQAGSGAPLTMCQTFLYLRGTSTSTGPSYLPASVTPAPALPPAPASNTSLGKITVSSGVRLDWTAPNEMAVRPTLADLATHKFEDLALWTEASTTSSLNGGGGMRLGGVFFLPNADPFNISGNASQQIDVDAQFFVRKLDVTGGATLRMIPNPANQVPLPTTAVNLIR
ncbi:MAG TPA: hypothetical protein VHM89_12825 [Acidimicrobiales bacterium]|nr:hypothetical protein [Acidimicrobiales bacterium]